MSELISSNWSPPISILVLKWDRRTYNKKPQVFFIRISFSLSFLFRRKFWRATLVYLFIPVHVNISCDTNSVSNVCYAFFIGNNFLEECSSFWRILFLLEIAIIIIFLWRPGFPGCLWILFLFHNIILFYFILKEHMRAYILCVSFCLCTIYDE